MTSVLQQLQAGYEQRAKQAAQAPVSPPAAPEYHFATRTYTRSPLARRQAWGQRWGDVGRMYRQNRLAREAASQE